MQAQTVTLPAMETTAIVEGEARAALQQQQRARNGGDHRDQGKGGGPPGKGGGPTGKGGGRQGTQVQRYGTNAWLRSDTSQWKNDGQYQDAPWRHYDERTRDDYRRDERSRSAERGQPSLGWYSDRERATFANTERNSVRFEGGPLKSALRDAPPPPPPGGAPPPGSGTPEGRMRAAADKYAAGSIKAMTGVGSMACLFDEMQQAYLGTADVTKMACPFACVVPPCKKGVKCNKCPNNVAPPKGLVQMLMPKLDQNRRQKAEESQGKRH